MAPVAVYHACAQPWCWHHTPPGQAYCCPPCGEASAQQALPLAFALHTPCCQRRLLAPGDTILHPARKPQA